MTKSWSFLSGLRFIQRGTFKKKNRLNINYLDLPLLIQYSIANRIGIHAGLILSYRISAKGYSIPRDSREDLTDLIEPFSFGLTGGLTYDFSDKVAANINYYHGLAYTWDISYRDANNNPIESVKYYNRNITLSVAFKIFESAKDQ